MDKLRTLIEKFAEEQHWQGSFTVAELFRAVAQALEAQNNRIKALEDRAVMARRKELYARLCDAPKARATVDARVPREPKRSKIDLSSFINK